jgi:hypothetical protein
MCTHEKIKKIIRIPAVLLKFHSMHGKARHVPMWPGLLLKHFRGERVK